MLAEDATVVDGVRPTFLQRLQLQLSKSQKKLVTAAEARARYHQYFPEIFSDFNISFLTKSKTSFQRLQSPDYAKTGLRSHNITIGYQLKNHPLYPVVHAHELVHVYDLEIGRLPSMAKDPELTLDSEIRAHYKQYVVAHKIFSQEELITLRDQEKDKNIKAYIDMIIKYQDPLQYVSILLLIAPDYKNLVREASGQTSLEGQARFLSMRVPWVLHFQSFPG